MRKTVVFVISFFALTVIANPVLDLVENIAGVRDIFVEFELLMRVKNQEKFQESSISGDLAIRNLEDFYLLIKEPSVISQLSFAYISRTKRLYSAFPGYLDMENIEVPITNFIEFFQNILKIIQTPVVVTSFDGDTVTVSPTALVAGKSKDPVVFKMKIKNGFIQELMITSKDESEYIKVKINKMSLNADVDKYFYFAR